MPQGECCIHASMDITEPLGMTHKRQRCGKACFHIAEAKGVLENFLRKGTISDKCS